VIALLAYVFNALKFEGVRTYRLTNIKTFTTTANGNYFELFFKLSFLIRRTKSEYSPIKGVHNVSNIRLLPVIAYCQEATGKHGKLTEC